MQALSVQQGITWGSDDTLGYCPAHLQSPRGPLANREPKPVPAPRIVPKSLASAAQALCKAAGSLDDPQDDQDAALDLASAARGPSSGSECHGNCIWINPPDGTSADSRLTVDLPESEFSYIQRPWSHFLTRWAAMDVELERTFGGRAPAATAPLLRSKVPFTLMDLGSCNGFICLQAAQGYPDALVVGVEGSVGVGNGTTGVQGTEADIVNTKAVQTHLRWAEKLSLPNLLLAPEVWDYQRVCALAALRRPVCDVLVSLSVVHHIDNISKDQYISAGLDEVQGAESLMANLLCLAPRHFIELPDRPWISHVYDAYGTANAFLSAAAKASGRQWRFAGPLCVSEWYGRRELWMLEDREVMSPMPREALRAMFPRLIGVSRDGAARVGGGGAHGAPAHGPANLQGAAQGWPETAPAVTAHGGLGQRGPGRVPPPPPMPAATLGGQPLPPSGAPPQFAPARGGQPSPQAALGAALLASPTALIAAHAQLRDAMVAANGTLDQVQRPSIHTRL